LPSGILRYGVCGKNTMDVVIGDYLNKETAQHIVKIHNEYVRALTH
jgi:hypothetical protein